MEVLNTQGETDCGCPCEAGPVMTALIWSCINSHTSPSELRTACSGVMLSGKHFNLFAYSGSFKLKLKLDPALAVSFCLRASRYF